ncbi:hypothetical protein HID58_049080 [Brassica napus]|uniref:Uncharacterized protein n=1 Tax=Brassica napus TaxID=3708 RepID=A0ABQ8B4S7_BRANA|nr:hypothetical protein HID58_049080 [Brassica napus]
MLVPHLRGSFHWARTQSHLTTAFLPSCGGGGGLRTGVSRSWNLEKRCNRFAVKCDAAVAEKETAEEGSGEKSEYQAEVSRLLDLIVHSLYSHKPDPDNGTITITDTGIGMTKEELIDCNHCSEWHFQTWIENKDLGADNGLTGQFGVGFYSAFLVAEKYVWESVADSSSYVIREETDPENFLRRGTQITLYLRNLVKNYSQFVGFPIYTWQEKSRTIERKNHLRKEKKRKRVSPKKTKKTTKTEKYWDWELANETKPLWMRNSKEVSKEEYNEFYKKAFSQFLDPLAHTHFTTEGEVEFRSILYIPGMSPLNNEDVTNPKTKNIRLHVKRVSQDTCFVKGIVDSNDLPLNVSPEILQESRIVSENHEKETPFFTPFLCENKELGCIEDTVNHKRITPLLRFYSSKNEEELTSLDECEDEVKEREAKQEFNILCDWMKQQLGDKVAKVQVSNRLSSSPCVLVSGKFGWSANMERLMKAQALGDTSSLEFMRGRRILEINPDHPIIKDLNAACKNAPESSEATRVVDLLYDTAIIPSGFTPDNPAELGDKIYEMMAMAVGGRWGRVEEEESSSVGEGDEKDGEAEVVELSEVRAESDPWQD